MELQDLYELKEVVGRYRNTISEFYSNPSVENIDALHYKIANVDLNEMPELFMRIDTNLKHNIETLIGCFENLEKDITNDILTIRRFDNGVVDVMVFCKTIIKELRRGVETLNNRISTTPDADDISSLDILNDYIDGKFGDMDFTEFLDEFVTSGLFSDWRIERRINYLICATDNEQIKSALSLYLTERKESQKPKPSPSVQPTAKEVATTNFIIAKVDADRLGSFFNKKFKSGITIDNHFDDLVRDIPKFKTNKELAMIAVLIYECRQYFIQRPSTFTAWLREFFEIIGRECPKDTRKNKYEPNDTIKRMFYYLE